MRGKRVVKRLFGVSKRARCNFICVCRGDLGERVRQSLSLSFFLFFFQFPRLREEGRNVRRGRANDSSVFVGNVPYDVDEAQLKDFMAEVGPVVSLRMVIDKETANRGYGLRIY